MRRVLLGLLALPLLSGCLLYSVARPAELPEGGEELHDLAYWAGPDFDDRKHRLDLYVPPGPGPHPVVVFVHGGGWRLGDRDFGFGSYEKLGRRLASRGLLTAVISYRLAPDHKHPAHVTDVARALAWTLAHAAEHRGDPRRLFALGHSAGAQLVALAACDPRYLREQGADPEQLAGVIGVSAPYDVLALGRSGLIGGVPMVIPAFGDDPATWRDVSPASHLGDGHLPPFLVAVGDSDPEILARHGAAFARALRVRGVAVEEQTISLRDHFTVVTELGASGDPLGDAIEAFVKRTPPTKERVKPAAGAAQ